MKEIDDRGPEFAAAYEPVKGGKHHKKLAGGLAARALLAAAMAGLLTLSVLTSEAEMRTPALYGGDPENNAPPAVEAPEEPTTPPPTTPPPTTPPPTTPPPTTPPPTTPPPTTPPPTTPPPTTPPPYIPPYNPPEPAEFTDPSLEIQEARYSYITELGSPPMISVYYAGNVYVGSATRVDIHPTIYVPADVTYAPDWARTVTSDTWFEEESISFPVPADFDPTGASGTLTLTLKYPKNGSNAEKTVTFALRLD